MRHPITAALASLVGFTTIAHAAEPEPCSEVRFVGSKAPICAAVPERAKDGQLTVWPSAEGEVEGWAGVSYALWGLAAKFARDGKRYVHCGNTGASCEVLRTSDGKRVEALNTSDTLDTANDGVLTARGIAKKVKPLKLTDENGPWADPDVIVSWLLVPGKGEDAGPETLVYVARDRQTGGEVELARFTLPAPDPGIDDSVGWVSPEPVQVSPDGKTIALRALYQQDQTLTTAVKLMPTKQVLDAVYAKRGR